MQIKKQEQVGTPTISEDRKKPNAWTNESSGNAKNGPKNYSLTEAAPTPKESSFKRQQNNAREMSDAQKKEEELQYYQQMTVPIVWKARSQEEEQDGHM